MKRLIKGFKKGISKITLSAIKTKNFLRQFAKTKKQLDLYTQLNSFSKRAITIGGKHYLVIKKRKQLFTRFYKLAVIFIALVIFIDSAHAYSHPPVDSKNSIPISGTQEQLTGVVGQINGYLSVADVGIENKISAEDPQSTDLVEFAKKPVITDTKSREEIERIKAEEERLKRIEEYNKKYRNTYARNYSPSRYTYNSVSNGYYYGYCTWYAKKKRPDLPNQLGNGGSWYYNAQSAGLATGQNPEPGSVIVTRESGWGHVGYVESVDGNNVTISEMNFNGWGAVNKRTLDINDSAIKGFVY